MGVKALYTGLLALSSISSGLAALDSSFFSFFEVIEKDVVIIGGGATGAHAAVRLREDYKKSVVVIEKEAILVSYWEPHHICYNLKDVS
jgi:ribulose 1,5-bisphosphate synthetase/thiazole synthase